MEEKKNQETKIKNRAGIITSIIWCVAMLCTFVSLQFSVIFNAVIPSESMEPTIMTGDRVIGNRLAYAHSDVERYDIVMFHDLSDYNTILIKRVMGLPGETLTIHDGNVYLVKENGEEEKLEDKFCMTPESTEEGDMDEYFTVPDNSYFVLGDNREMSYDARFWNKHFVPKDYIIAEAGVRYFPFNRIAYLGN